TAAAGTAENTAEAVFHQAGTGARNIACCPLDYPTGANPRDTVYNPPPPPPPTTLAEHIPPSRQAHTKCLVQLLHQARAQPVLGPGCQGHTSEHRRQHRRCHHHPATHDLLSLCAGSAYISRDAVSPISSHGRQRDAISGVL